jgi:ABC-type sugar transport system ATPase subunit
MPVHGLPNDQKKLIQILRAVHLKASVLLMDEPTSSLTERGIAIVHGLIKNLAARGVGVVFISHYITEIFDVCDDITVLRDGRVVGKHRTADSSIHTVVMDMLGKELKQKQRSSAVIDRSSEVMLHVRDLTIPGKIKDVTFDLHRGEILGITGIIGSGLTDLSAALFNMGNTKGRSGRVSIDEDGILLDSPYTAIKSGIALLTNDRLNEGILPSFPIYENICLPILKRFRNPVGLLNLQDMIETGQRCIEKLSIKTRDAITKLY